MEGHQKRGKREKRETMMFNHILIILTMLLLVSMNANGVRDIAKFEKIQRLCHADIICLQETHWDNVKQMECRLKSNRHFFVNNGGDKSCGVAILVGSRKVTDLKVVYNDLVGRIIMIEFKYNGVIYNLMNIYAPNGEKERKTFFECMSKEIRGNCVIVGDFNMKSCRLDSANTSTFKADVSRTALKEIMNKEDMCDVWRMRNPIRREYSRVQVSMGTLKQSRIDLCLAKNVLCDKIGTMEYKMTGLSDHAILRFSLEDTVERKGGGLWCLNISLLTNENYQKMTKKLIEREVAKPSYIDNIIEWWEELKEKIKYRTIRFSKNLNYNKRQREREIKTKIININAEDVPDTERLLRLQNELNEIELKRCEGAIVRSRAQYAVEGEKSTSFFLKLEKARQSKCYIEKVRDKRGECTADLVDIANTVQEFYTDLFRRGGAEGGIIDEMVGKIAVKISETEKEGCDQDIRIGEIKEAISELKGNKSPGSDGLPSDFFKSFVNELAPILLDLYREIEKEETVPRSMSMGIITLVFKQKGSKECLENYRPISILNTDYKILTKILANRIKEVLGTIIESTQTYSIPGREINDTVNTIRDVIEWVKGKEQGGIILNLDFNKAFDRVEHEYLFRTLEEFGFGCRIVEWIKLLYRDAKSRVKVNGILTDPFNLERSVRQGCPLSAILYAIAAEPLALLLKNDKMIKKIKLPGGSECVVQQYADDTTCMVKDMDSIKRIVELVDKYGKASGAKINVNKSEIMFINTNTPDESEVQFKIKKDYMRILGIYMGIDSKGARDNLWTEVINKMQKIFNMWKLRDLKLKGKITVVNGLILSKINYILASVDLPPWAGEQINGMVTQFIWGARVGKIARRTLIAEYEQGGLKLIDVECKKKALRMKVVLKYLYDETVYGWKECFRRYLESVIGCGDFTLLMSLKRSMLEGLPGFYKEVLLAHTEYFVNVDYVCEDANAIRGIPIFLNKKIKHDNHVLHNGTFMLAGVKQMKDIMYEVIPGFMPTNAAFDMIRRINDTMPRKTIMNFMEKILTSLPGQWKDAIKTEIVSNREIGLPELKICKNNEWVCMKVLKTKEMYQWFVSREMQPPASLEFWRRAMQGFNTENVWNKWRINENSIECEDNDFRIRHNKICTNVILHQIDRTTDRTCDICKTEPENLHHLFVNCAGLNVFFVRLKNLLERRLNIAVGADDSWATVLLFGLHEENEGENVTLCNYVLSHARLAIRLSRNYAHFEKRIVNTWCIFKSIMQKDVRNRYIFGTRNFSKVFLKGNTLITVNGRGGLVWNW